MRKLLVIITVIAALAIALTVAALAFTKQIPHEEGTSTEVYFCPEENCSYYLYNTIIGSKEVKCAFYELNLPEIKDALKSQKLVMDDENVIKGAKADSSTALMHNKFCVLDDGVATGSFNPTPRGNIQNNNNLLVIRSKLLKKLYEEEFDEMWGGKFHGGTKTQQNKAILDGKLYEAYFCPEDGCEKRLIEAINGAKTSIHFMTFSFTSKPVAEALILAAQKGVEVKGVMEKSQLSQYAQYERLTENGIAVRKDSNPGSMHHKVFIIDSSTAITGSYNPTANGNTRNDENMLVIQDALIAAEFGQEFSKIFITSTAV